MGYVPEADLPYLMNAAEALIHPSRYEGFGIPPVEAMACGCPVLVSNIASLPEICGDAALYFSPDEPEQLVSLMTRISDETGLKERLRLPGIERASRYTWKNTAEKTIPVLTRW